MYSYCPQVVELFEGSGVFVLKPDFSRVKKLAKTTTQVARGLMDCVFTTEALLGCSLQGELSTAGGTGQYKRRTALDSNAVEAIQGKTASLMNFCHFGEKNRA